MRGGGHYIACFLLFYMVFFILPQVFAILHRMAVLQPKTYCLWILLFCVGGSLFKRNSNPPFLHECRHCLWILGNGKTLAKICSPTPQQG